jgi:hypothetical protein
MTAEWNPFCPVGHIGVKVMPTYYYIKESTQIEAILRDGFLDEYKDTTTGINGVYLADSPGAPDPEYPDDQLLEITLPPEISISQFEAFKHCKGDTRWREWVLPAELLNECAEVRVVPNTEWSTRWKQWVKQRAKQHQLPTLPAESNEKTPDPDIIRQNAEAFEALAIRWMDSRTGKPADTDLRTAVIYMILDYFDCDNSADLYYGDLLASVKGKLRLVKIKFGG